MTETSSIQQVNDEDAQASVAPTPARKSVKDFFQKISADEHIKIQDAQISTASILFKRSVKRRVSVDEQSSELIVVDSDDMSAQPLHPTAVVNDSDRLTRAADGIVLTVIDSDIMPAQTMHSVDAAIQSDRLTRAAENDNIIAQQLENLIADESIILSGCRMEDSVVEKTMANDEDDAVADHSFFQNCSCTTMGSANTQVHAHPMGLAHVVFENCVVKVRLGFDLDRLIALSRIGPVSLHNIHSSGWIPTGETLLPAYVFLRWISSMVAVE
jgi:hypothetical protein